MKIAEFRIRKYRNIEDSGPVRLLDRLTCVVGKNQSGKTALLKALHKFNPHTPQPYDMRREWPRGQRTSRDPRQVVCEVTFVLDDEEKASLAEFASQTMSADRVVITKDYDGRFEISFSDKPGLFPDALHPNDIDKICDELTLPAPDASASFKRIAQECVDEAKRCARESRFSAFPELQQSHTERLRAGLTAGAQQPQAAAESQYVGAHTTSLGAIERQLNAGLTMHQRAHDYLVKRIPTFIYMDDYKTFHGRANLEQVKINRDNAPRVPLTEEEETFLMILRLAALDLDQLITQGASREQDVIHDRQIDLEDAGRTLTNNVAGRWGQNNYRVEFRADGQVFLTDIEETDKTIGMIPLEEQSKGFQWFFSFDLHFMHESGGTFAGCVLLLDEPGLHLHPGGQADLLARLDAYSERNTTVYTTHLPFLVDLREPARIKVINQGKAGAEVSEDLNASGPAERLTLQAALGMRANQSYLVADRNLVVEGADDYWLVTELSNLLIRAGKPGLPEDVMVTAAGSASDVVHLATFMIGQGLGVVALFDSDEAGQREEERLRTKWITRYKSNRGSTVLLAAAIRASGELTIEDLFPEDFYLWRARESHAQKLKAAGKSEAELTLTGSGPIVKRVEATCARLGIAFNKGSVAKILRRELAAMHDLTILPDGLAEKAEALMRRLQAEFDRVSPRAN